MNKFVADGAKIIGDVKLGDNCSVWYNAVIRADVSPVVIGDGSNVQDCCVIHGEAGTPTVIGSGVSVGHGAILHSCEIGDNTLVGMGAIVLNRAKIGKNCIIGAGALITQNTVVPDNSMYLGSPAKFFRSLTAEEIAANRSNADQYIKLAFAK